MKSSKKPDLDIYSRGIIALIMAIIGLVLMVFGFFYSYYYLDSTSEASGYSSILGSSTILGYVLLISIPIVLKRWFITPILLLLTIAFFVWAELS